MYRYSAFTKVVRSQPDFRATLWRFVAQGWGSLLLEEGTFLIDSTIPAEALDLELYLGDGAWLDVYGGLTPNVHLTLPEEYVEALDQSPTAPGRSRRLYWSSPTPPVDLDDPSQNPYGYGDVTLYVPRSLEPSYREKEFSEGGATSRRYLEIWDYEPPAADGRPDPDAPSEVVESPGHYTWLGQALAELGLSDAANVESWDVLDAAFPSDPLLWNCGKYLLRQGRKGGEEKRLEDLRKARQYLDRQIAQLSRGGE
nr:MAG TPA: nucelotide kinase [Caudoviricetes sp.]